MIPRSWIFDDYRWLTVNIKYFFYNVALMIVECVIMNKLEPFEIIARVYLKKKRKNNVLINRAKIPFSIDVIFFLQCVTRMFAIMKFEKLVNQFV